MEAILIRLINFESPQICKADRKKSTEFSDITPLARKVVCNLAVEPKINRRDAVRHHSNQASECLSHEEPVLRLGRSK